MKPKEVTAEVLDDKKNGSWGIKVTVKGITSKPESVDPSYSNKRSHHKEITTRNHTPHMLADHANR